MAGVRICAVRFHSIAFPAQMAWLARRHHRQNRAPTIFRRVWRCFGSGAVVVDRIGRSGTACGTLVCKSLDATGSKHCDAPCHFPWRNRLQNPVSLYPRQQYRFNDGPRQPRPCGADPASGAVGISAMVGFSPSTKWRSGPRYPFRRFCRHEPFGNDTIRSKGAHCAFARSTDTVVSICAIALTDSDPKAAMADAECSIPDLASNHRSADLGCSPWPSYHGDRCIPAGMKTKTP
jgi:hypothetical protein